MLFVFSYNNEKCLKCTVNLKTYFFEYYNAEPNDGKNLISKNIPLGFCCFWYYRSEIIDLMVKLKKLDILLERYELKVDKWFRFKFRKADIWDLENFQH